MGWPYTFTTYHRDRARTYRPLLHSHCWNKAQSAFPYVGVWRGGGTQDPVWSLYSDDNNNDNDNNNPLLARTFWFRHCVCDEPIMLQKSLKVTEAAAPTTKRAAYKINPFNCHCRFHALCVTTINPASAPHALIYLPPF